jgi:quercetin dioxygenase-like cupin family protein
LDKDCTVSRAGIRIPVPGNKLIEEFIGNASTGDRNISVAHMVAPPGWTEPEQTPQFDEVTIMIRGKMRVLVNGVEHILGAGEVILCNKGASVQYSNPFDTENEYWAVCVPAFTVDSARRVSE